MVNAEIKRKAEEYVKLVSNEFQLRIALLFGSHVRGDANQYSDIDVALVIEEKPGADPLEDEICLRKLRRSIDYKISPTLFYMDEYEEREPAGFISEVLRTGQVIYEREMKYSP